MVRFLAYNKAGHLVSTVYMVPIKDIEAHKKIEERLKQALGAQIRGQ